MNKKKEILTIMAVPHFEKQSFKFNISLTSLYLIIFLIVEIALFNIILYLSYYQTKKEVKELRKFKNIYEAQQKQIMELDCQTYALKKRLLEVQNLEKELRKTVGLKGEKKERGITVKTSRAMQRDTSNLRKKYYEINKELNKNIDNLKELKKTVENKKRNLEYIPSCYPSRGRIGSFFGRRWGRYHDGIDIEGSYGDPIKATAGGIVTLSGWKKGYGYCVIIDHLNGYSTVYGHNSKNLVKVGDKVKKGDIIANLGATGHATGPHLHYEVRKNNIPINPTNYLNLSVKNIKLEGE